MCRSLANNYFTVRPCMAISTISYDNLYNDWQNNNKAY